MEWGRDGVRRSPVRAWQPQQYGARAVSAPSRGVAGYGLGGKGGTGLIRLPRPGGAPPRVISEHAT